MPNSVVPSGTRFGTGATAPQNGRFKGLTQHGKPFARPPLAIQALIERAPLTT
jgi:hypothetical protein